MDESTPQTVCDTGSGGTCVALTNVVALSLGRDHTCALLSNEQVKCWGDAAHGEIGNDKTPLDFCAGLECNRNPQTVCNLYNDCVTPLGDVHAIAAGNEFTCALLGTGKVKCWGSNSTNELSDGSTTQRDAPVYVCESGDFVADDCNAGDYFPRTANHSVVAMSARDHMCMLRVDEKGRADTYCTGQAQAAQDDLGPGGSRACGVITVEDP